MKKSIYLTTIVLLFGVLFNAPAFTQNVAQNLKNYTIERVYDEDGNVISYIQVYRDKLGREEQSQQKDLENDDVIVRQTVYDRFGRAALQSLPAPAYKLTTDVYLFSFMTNPGGGVYSSEDFDQEETAQNSLGEVFNPKVVDNQTKGSLGWYYSDNNNEESYVPSSSYPFYRNYARKDATNAPTYSSAAGELRMGNGHERRIVFKHPSNELKYIYNKDGIFYKSISIDEEKLEEVTYTNKKGLVVAQCYSGEGIDNCIPKVQTYYLNTSEYNGAQKSVDLHLPVGSSISIEKVLPSSACTTVTADVNIYLINLLTGALLVEGTDYTIDAQTYDVTFLGGLAGESKFIQVKVEFPEDWLDCAFSTGVARSVDLKDQIVKVNSFYGSCSLYKYDSKDRLIEVIPPQAVDCRSYDYTLSSQTLRGSNFEYLFGTKNPDGSCNPNHIMNDVVHSRTFNLVNTDVYDYKYSFSIWTAVQPVPIYFENDPPPPCDYGQVDPTKLHSTKLGEIEFDENGFLVDEEGSGDGEDVGPNGEVNFYDIELHKRKYLSDILFRHSSLPEVVISQLGGLNDRQVVDTFLQNSHSRGDFLEAFDFPSFGDEADEASITSMLEKREKGNNQYNHMLRGGGDNDIELELTCENSDFHCFNDKQDCGETDVNEGAGCPVRPPCYQKPLLTRGTIKAKVIVEGKNIGTGNWESIEVIPNYIDGQLDGLRDHVYLYIDLLFDCECNYFLSLNTKKNNAARGVMDLQELLAISDIQYVIEEVLYAENNYSDVQVFRPINTQNTFEFLAHFVRVNVADNLRRIPHVTTPLHDLSKTIKYEYNFYNQLTKETNPDKGITNYYYDDLQRLKFWQSAAQLAEGKFSYLDYDELGRVVERGQLLSASVPNDVLNSSVAASAYVTEEEHNVEYDKEGSGFPIALNAYEHRYLKGRVSKTSNAETKTWYGYDMRGRLSWTVQHIKGLSREFTINYEYNAQGNIKTLDFQKETSAERLVHHYDYDANGRLTNVKTSTDGIYANAIQHAAYEYYQHGPLKRTELGDALQGIDYVYTVNGRLKSINNPYIGVRDPGQDGQTGSSHANFAEDLFGMTIDYFVGDYSRMGTGIQTYNEHSFDQGTNPPTLIVHPSQYNGNINSVRWRTRSEVHASVPQYEGKQLIYVPQYDLRHRIKSAQFGTISAGFEGIQNTSQVPPPQSWDGPNPTMLDDYKLWNIDYSANGNLETLNRNGHAAGGLDMDELTFHRSCNRLSHVQDAKGLKYTNDLANQSASNYGYDASGRLISDQNESNYMAYNSSDLTTFIYKDAAKTIVKACQFYDERGQRLFKKKFDQTTGILTDVQYYVRDVNGSLMGIINQDMINSVTSVDLAIYGSSQLGFYNTTGQGSYRYQLTDHLGNLRASINRTKVNNDVQLLSMQDYYPFGSLMPGRSISPSTFYKLGYQSQPEDEETGFNAFELRLYDARIGGWLSPDPYNQHFSPYMAMSNNPMSFIDPDGGYDEVSNTFDTGCFGCDNGMGDWQNTTLDGMPMGQFTALMDMLYDACPNCSGEQLFRLRVGMMPGGGFRDGVLEDINYEISRATGTLIRDEQHSFVGTDITDRFGNKIGENLNPITYYSYRATNHINTDHVATASRLLAVGGAVWSGVNASANHTTYVTTRGETKTIINDRGRIRSARARGAARVSSAIRGISNTLAVGSVALDLYGLNNYYNNNDPNAYVVSPLKFATNLGVTTLGMAGTASMGVGAGAYFLIDGTIGWDNAQRAATSVRGQNQAILGKNWPLMGRGLK